MMTATTVNAHIRAMVDNVAGNPSALAPPVVTGGSVSDDGLALRIDDGKRPFWIGFRSSTPTGSAATARFVEAWWEPGYAETQALGDDPGELDDAPIAERLARDRGRA